MAKNATKIGTHVFRGCSNLKTINLPKTVESIGEASFAQCEALKTVNYGGSESDFGKITIGSDNTFLTEAEKSYNQKIN
ncbi:MAG: leucine-rich repeat protein [Clostridia bacterium]|nr:leucine-rich repeat protein [Clostridia bacterium]